MGRYAANRTGDFNLRVAMGLVSGVSAVAKFGDNEDIDTNSTPEDVWSNGGLWSPPDTASIHTIVSSHVSDDGRGSGATYTGARTVHIHGLQTWDTSETSELVTLNGTDEVVTTNSYVIIHRMEIELSGTSDTNRGTISATANDASDTSTAFIEVEKGQTHMAIYGISSLDKFYITHFGIDLNKSGQAGTAQIELVVRHAADVDTGSFHVESTLGLNTTGSSHLQHTFVPYKEIEGPAYMKIHVETVSGNNTSVSAAFEGFLVKNTAVL